MSSSDVRVTKMRGLWLVTHRGVMTQRSSEDYERLCVADGLCPGVDLIDAALTVFPPVPRAPSVVNAVPRAVIVRPDQYPQAVKFCLALASVGVLRTAWLRSQLDLALEWALMARGAR